MKKWNAGNYSPLHQSQPPLRCQRKVLTESSWKKSNLGFSLSLALMTLSKFPPCSPTFAATVLKNFSSSSSSITGHTRRVREVGEGEREGV